MKRIVFLFCGIMIIGLVFNKYVDSEQPPQEEPVISLDFKDASLKDILKVFSIQSGLNFIASEDVQDKKITLYLEKVPLKEAMDKLFKANNLEYKLDKEAKIFIVRPSGLEPVETITRIYTLKYASVASSSLVREVNNSLLGQSQLGQTQTQQTESAGISEAIKKVLSPVGKLIEEPRTNSLIITDVPAKFSLIEEIIKKLDTPTPQIMLEVEMLDVNKNRLERMGIKFGDITAYPSLLQLTITGAQRGTKFPFSAFWPEEGATSPKDKTLPGSISFANPYQILLDFIKSQSDTRILARPRILTLNNEPAEIKITANEAVNMVRTKDPDTGEITTTYERMEVGVSLRIVPQVNLENNEITMFIAPEVSNTKVSNIASNVYDPEKRLTKSLVKVKDGETIIVGGLIHNELAQTTTKLPILGDIPIIGNFFKHKEVGKNKERELLVFITPRIIKEKSLTTLSQNIPLEREQVLDTDILRHKTINNLLNNFEKAK
jgi:type II secretory pathway component GspD/PulD (secretin)